MKPCEAFLVLDQDVRAISYIVILYTINTSYANIIYASFRMLSLTAESERGKRREHYFEPERGSSSVAV